MLQSSTRTPHEVIEHDPYLEAMHANAEVFDYNTERLFRYLQVRLALYCSPHILYVHYALLLTVSFIQSDANFAGFCITSK